MTSPLTVRTITPEEHLGFIRQQRSASFLQTPAWAKVKSEWKAESLGWFAGSELVGVALVLYRQLPKVKRYLAYLPEGPVIDWHADELSDWLAPMTKHLAEQGAFGVRMGPPVVTRRWSAADVKKGVADDSVRTLTEIAPAERSQVGARVVSQLTDLGWRLQAVEGGFAAGQPRYNFQIPLKGRTEDDVLKGMNQQWRRNIKKAAKEGVEVTRVANEELEPALKEFHDLYTHTAERDHFTPRPLSYFQTMFRALLEEEPDRIRLYLARHEGDLVAATIWVRVGGHTWYSYGASSTEKRDVRGSNAAQWAMISDSLAAGADVYDLRGITDTLDPEDPHVGLIQFKVGTGGEAVEYAGEWDLPLRPLLYKAFEMYMKRRG
ncbi:MAG TPA: peptidoglycan bridge formation glycyltransferase FemA/FemB family protein [Nocardioidaceae bacterium]|nr:peptidoglycan bridge formation glycyltransferase FemA/FemB family protein [Nocardioidaceae bacterium]